MIRRKNSRFVANGKGTGQRRKNSINNNNKKYISLHSSSGTTELHPMTVGNPVIILKRRKTGEAKMTRNMRLVNALSVDYPSNPGMVD